MQAVLFPALIALSILVGGALGVIPYADTVLHINLWFVIPVGGFLLGMVVALLNFGIMFKTHMKVSNVALVVLGLGGAAAYTAADYGTYYTYEFVKEGQTYKLRDVATFGEYMDVRLSKTSISHHSSKVFEVGDTGSRIFYGIDLLGAFIGTLGILAVLRERYPFCGRCTKYLQVTYKKELKVKEESVFKTLFDGISKAIQECNGDNIRQAFEATPHEKKGGFMVFFESRGCPSCARGHALLRPSVLQKNNWVEVKALTINRDLESPLIRRATV